MIEKAKRLWHITFNDSLEYIDWYFKEIYPKNDALIEIKKDRIIGATYINRYRYVAGYEFSANYLVGISVPQEYQKQGIFKKMMLDILKKSYYQGDEVIFLTPIDKKIYSKYGFSYVGGLYSYECNFEHLRELKREYRVERIEKERDISSELSNFYKNHSAEFYLKVKRDKDRYDELISELRCEDGDIYIAYDSLDRIKGYMFLLRDENNISIKEILVADESGLKSLLAVVYGFKNYYEKIFITTSESLELESYFSTDFKLVKKVKNKLQARVLRVEKALERISDLLLDDEKLRVKVLDDIIEENNKTFLITKDNLVIDECDEVDIVLDIANLTSIRYGFTKYNELIKNQILKNNEKIEILKRVLKREINYFNQDF